MKDVLTIKQSGIALMTQAMRTDFDANSAEGSSFFYYLFLDRNPIVRFLVTLRILEYVFPRRKNILFRILSHLFSSNYKRLSFKTGFSIPIFTVAPGVSLPHFGPIIINPKSFVGARARIHVGVNIGGNDSDVPHLGNDVYLGPGCKLFGKIYIHDGCRIGANAVVMKSSTEVGSTLVGIPAREVIKS